MNLNQPDAEDPQPSPLTSGYTNNLGSEEGLGKYYGGQKRSKFGVLVANIRWWNKIFVISSVIAVTVDPLFFYIPIIDEENKCLGKDKKVMTAALLLRSLTDIIFLVHFVYHIYEAIKTKNSSTAVASITNKVTAKSPKTPRHFGLKSDQLQELTEFVKIIDPKKSEYAKEIAQKMSRLYLFIAIDFCVLLPIPQVLIIVVFYTKMEGYGYLESKKVLNLFLLGQYLPKIYRIYLSSKEQTKTTGMWAKGLFNFFLYILASHVLGSFWNFFSIQRETKCWQRACKEHDTNNYTTCMSAFYCDESSSEDMIAFFNKHCTVNPSEGIQPPFNFGIFHDSLKNHNDGEDSKEQINFARKYFYSFWWGLRNLSNFGTNLTTSTYEWENLFAILISIIGLVLFLYLIGNVQAFMQMETTKSEEIRRKIKMKELDVQRWISKNGLPDHLKKEIMKNIRQKLEENKDADLQNLFSILPWQTRKSIKRCLCMNTLKTVPKLATMNVKVLKMICDYLKPVMYNESSFVFRMRDPLDCMIFIVEGTILTYSTSGGDSEGENSPSRIVTKPLVKGEYYGEELLDWASATFNPRLPTSTHHVKSHTKVEAFALMAKDITTIVSKCQQYWDFNNCNSAQELERVASSTITAAIRRRLCMPQRSPRPAVKAHTELVKLRVNLPRTTSNYLQSPHY